MIGGGLLASHAAGAATIYVTHPGDTGMGFTCTLRQAVLAANTNAPVGSCTAGTAGSDIVSLAGLSGTITLASQIVVTESVTIQGPGAGVLAVAGNHSTRLFDVVDSGTPVTLSIDGLTLRDGAVTDDVGGCIRAQNSDHMGLVTVSNSVVSGCTATATTPGVYGGVGGAIYSNGLGQDKYSLYSTHSVLLQNSTLTGNSATGSGGAVAGVSVRLENSLVSNNLVNGFAGAGSSSPKYSGGGGVTSLLAFVNNSTITGNQANPILSGKSAQLGMAVGGGLLTGLAFVQNSTISQNRLWGTQAAQNATYDVLYGAGVAALGGGAFTSSTISGNVISAKPAMGSGGPSENWLAGGALWSADYYGTNLAIFNSTIAGNRVEGSGAAGSTDHFGPGGIAYTSSGRGGAGHAGRALFNKTRQAVAAKLVRGTAAAAFGPAAAAPNVPLTLFSSIVSNSVGGPDIGCSEYGLGPCTVPLVIGGDHNLVMSAGTGITLPGDTVTADPLLWSLADNGGTAAGAPGASGTGPNKTHALRPSSPALNAGSIATLPPLMTSPLLFDQRGPGFPRVMGGRPDIGAAEGAVAQSASTMGIPALNPYGLGLLAGLLAFFGRWRRSRPGGGPGSASG